jgi:multidrug resistance efflux pump
VRAPANGFVSNLSLAAGDRTTPFKAAMSFERSDEITLLALFPQNGMQTVRKDVPVKLAFASVPGRVYDTSIESIIGAVGEGQIGVSGTLARTTTLPPTEYYPVRIRIPADIDPAAMRLGMAGVVTAISPNAGPIGLIATILMHVKAFALYI